MSNDRLLKAARELIRREMHQYDKMAQQPRLRYERSLARDDARPLLPTASCAHNILLHHPCDKCERSIEDCRVYEVAMLFRVRELLSKLD